MNNKTLLTRKRNRNDCSTSSEPLKNINLDTQMVHFNGFNIIELYNTEFIENNIISNKTPNLEKNEIELQESNIDLSELGDNNEELKEMVRTKAKNIEEYYTSKLGNCAVKENCFKCLMTDFLSNELLYFNTKKDLFNYCKYCFISKYKRLFINESIYKENKDNFLKANTFFLKGWNFFIPKTICKGCFMEIINMKNLLSNIKSIFSDTEKDTLCKTNYRNYSLFSPRFRQAFSLKKKSRRIKRPTRNIIRNNNIKIDYVNNINEINLKKNGNSNVKKDIKTNKKKDKEKEKEKKYNKGVKVDNSNDRTSIIIDKKILDSSLIKELNELFISKDDKNNSKYINNNEIIDIHIKNDNYKEKEKKSKSVDKIKQNININLRKDINSNKDEDINNIKNCSFKGKNNINIINNISINNNQNGLNLTFIELINNQIREYLLNMFENFYKFLFSLEQMRRNMISIVEKMSFIINIKDILFSNPQLLKITSIVTDCHLLNYIFDKEKKNYEIYLLNVKCSTEKVYTFLDNSLNEIKKYVVNIDEKKKMIDGIQILKEYVDENRKDFDKFSEQFNIFNNIFCLFLNLVKEIVYS